MLTLQNYSSRGEIMKKKIANGLELLLLFVSFILLTLPTLKIVLAASNNTSLAVDGSIIGFTERGLVYVIFFLYAVTALMCIISIIAKPKHRDGKMHVIMPILLFLYCVSAGNYEVDKDPRSVLLLLAPTFQP